MLRKATANLLVKTKNMTVKVLVNFEGLYNSEYSTVTASHLVSSTPQTI